MADAERIAGRLEELWQIAHGPGGGADRPAYSEAEAQAMRRVAGWATELGLRPAIDRHGNLWALPEDHDGPILTSGSHVDTVPDGGRYDGALGTVLGLELVADLGRGAPETGGGAVGTRDRAAHDVAPADPGARPALLVCAAEEAPRFGAGTVGSRLLAGTLSEAALAALHDAEGVSAAHARERYLAALSDVPRIEPPLQRIRAHAEVHVALRAGPDALGIVTRVAAPRRLEVVIDGRAGHAGEIGMDERRDALAAAAEVVLAVEAAARAAPPPTVATVGALSISPGAVSVVPGRARLGIDMRAIESAPLDRLEARIREAVADAGARRDVRARTTLVRGGDPVALDRDLAARALAAAASRGVPATETWSGAGHDVQHLAAFAPALLVFVPLRGGESHTPQEGAAMADVLAAADIVADVMRTRLDAAPSPVESIKSD
ncbi:MAG TPA: M20/M25/M40 family metallo-hydrolase [Solirubrobacteraceae bacterium]|nr:M20/M25/M40 family metallo-hydrolase [Solirubrobacteraceae bacterium]